MAFSGITSYGKGYDVGGTNAAGKPLGTPANGIGSGALITSSVISGIGEVANSFIEAGRRKATAKFNAGMADISGRMVRTVAKYEIQRIREKSDALFSKQRALYAKSGVTFSGSPAAVMQASLKEAELDAFNTELTAEMSAWNIQMQGRIGKAEVAGAYGDAGIGAAKTILNTATYIGAR